MTRPRRQSPTTTARQLSALLVVARKEAGLTQESAARAAGWSKRKQQMLETAELVVAEADLAVLLDRLGVPGRERRAWHDLAAEARQKGWWDHYDPSDLPAVAKRFVGLEQGAVRICCFEPIVVPGLLQTPAYRREVIKAVSAGRRSAQQIAAIVEVTGRRQEILSAPEPLELWAVLDEAALRRAAGGPEVMREQLARIADLAEARPNLTMQIFPARAGLHPGLHGTFAIMEFGWPADPGLVYVEAIPDHPSYLTSRADVYAFTQVFEQITSLATGPDETVEMLRDLAGHRPDHD